MTALVALFVGGGNRKEKEFRILLFASTQAIHTPPLSLDQQSTAHALFNQPLTADLFRRPVRLVLLVHASFNQPLTAPYPFHRRHPIPYTDLFDWGYLLLHPRV